MPQELIFIIIIIQTADVLNNDELKADLPPVIIRRVGEEEYIVDLKGQNLLVVWWSRESLIC